jgi:ATP-dependent exoDNAse (exonuclease V) beta subunit
MSPQRPAPDQDHRDGAIRARGVNVLVDAGAGTGKTTLLVGRLVEMVAP